MGRLRLRFRIADLLYFLTAFAVLATVASAWDALVVLLILPYSVAFGPFWRWLVSRRTSSELTIATWTSAIVVCSFIGILTGISALIFVLSPESIFALQSVHKVFTVSAALYSSFIIAFLFLGGDSYNSELQMLLHGFPFGLSLNLATGFFVGAGFGRLAHFLNSLTQADRSLTTLDILRAMASLTMVYVRRMASAILGYGVTYQMGYVFALAVVIGIFTAIGYRRYTLLVLLFACYVILFAPRWRRFVSHWTTGEPRLSIVCSAGVVSSFNAILSVTCMFLFLIGWYRSSATVQLALLTSRYLTSAFGWLIDVEGLTRLRLYILPFGLTLNIAVGLLAGAALGLVAHSIRTSDSITQ